MSAQNTTRTASSSDRVAVLTTARPIGTVATTKAVSVRFNQTARRILNSLMRSLAAPHC